MVERVVEVWLALLLLAAAITEDVEGPHERHGVEVVRGCHDVSAATGLPRLLGCCDRHEGERQEGAAADGKGLGQNHGGGC